MIWQETSRKAEIMDGSNWKLEDDLKTVTITFSTVPPIQLRLDALAVDELLGNLGNFRASMRPEVANGYTLGQKVAAVPKPAWMTEPEIMNGNSLLHLGTFIYPLAIAMVA